MTSFPVCSRFCKIEGVHLSYSSKTISEIVSEFINRTTFLPAIQREYVWDTADIEKLFDSIMGDYPISSFLFWKIREEKKAEWTAYEFIRNFAKDQPHNTEANITDVHQDINLVLDGQQRLTSLFIGLKGSYRYFYFRWRETRLYLNLLKAPVAKESPEDLTYQFKFRETEAPDARDPQPQLWYLVGDILNSEDAEEAKRDIKARTSTLSDAEKENANSLLGRLHQRIHTTRPINYYEEKSQDYDKVVQVFIRANTGGKKLEYSDILLSTATAKWKTLNARDEIHSFTDEINTIGLGYTFGKDFVLKGCLYLTDGLPIQYNVKNFNRVNLEKIEGNWETIKENIQATVSLVSKFGFSDKNLVAKFALLPIAFYIKKSQKKNFIKSTKHEDVLNQIAIQKWLSIALLKNAFSNSDMALKNLQETLLELNDSPDFPYRALNKKLAIESTFSPAEVENLLSTQYSSKYSYLVLSLLYPDRDWKDSKYHEDHIFPKTEFTAAKLKQRGYDENKVKEYQKYFNTVINLQLLTDTENQEKSSEDFGSWFAGRDKNFRTRHTIPEMTVYSFDDFLEFVQKRRVIVEEKLSRLSF